jgi:hypothetical protein
MSTFAALESTAVRFSSAKSYQEIFGMLPKGSEDVQMEHLRHQVRYLMKIVHPDVHADADKVKAGQVFDELNQLRKAAEQAVKEKRYEKPFGARSPLARAGGKTFNLASAKGIYELHADSFAKGDFSVFYRGHLQGVDNVSVVAKVASAPASNSWLEKEASMLIRFRDAKKGDALSSIAKFVPELLDTFLVENAKQKRYRVVVMRDSPDMVSVSDIIRAYPSGLDPRDASWIYRRILAQTLAASMAGVVHGAMTSDHVLVDPYTHNPLHTGWAHSVKDGRITHIVDRFRDYYPPEVFEKKKVTHQTDLYMAGKMMIHLLGGDVKRNSLPRLVPSSVAQVILRSIEPSPARRPQDGLQLLDEFTRVIRQEWGRAYRPLTIPLRN